MELIKKINRAISSAKTQYIEFNMGDIRIAKKEANITHNNKYICFDVQARSLIMIPKDENVGFTKEDVKTTFEIILWDTYTRKSGKIIKSGNISEIFPDVKEDKEFEVIKNNLLKRIEFSEEYLKNATERRKEAIKQFTEQFQKEEIAA